MNISVSSAIFSNVQFVLLCLAMTGCTTVHKFDLLEPQEITNDFSCENLQSVESNTKNNHLLRSNRDGLVIDQHAKTERWATPLDPKDALAKFRHILCNAENVAQKEQWNGVNIFVYVHGGLNGFNASQERLEISKNIIKEGQYPVYLAWPSGAITTWSEHTFRIREGKKANPFVGLITSPFIFSADILRSLGNYPSTLSYQITNEKDRFASWKIGRWLPSAWKDSAALFCPEKVTNPTFCNSLPKDSLDLRLKTNYSDFKSHPGFTSGRALGQIVTLPLRYTLGSLWHSGISSAAWGNMKRRAKNITYPTHEFDSRYTNGLNAGTFFHLLAERARNRPEKNYKITLIGHSMGTIVINNILDRYHEQWAASGALENIVYMAGAATIGDTLKSLSPILVPRPNNVDGTLFSPNFYNLTLNRVAEVSEMHGYGAIPTGSLLVSIDQHHDKPEHPLNRTIGSEVNVHSSIFVIDEALKQSTGKVVFKSFNRRDSHHPSNHGEFGLIPFWRPTTWALTPDENNVYGSPFRYRIYDDEFEWF